MTHPNVKTVKVTVNAGSVVCTPERVSVSAANTLLVFKLETAGYVFPDSGAVVVGQPGGEFPYPLWMENPKVVALFDRNSAAADFSYTVNVVDQSSGQRYRLDPIIGNEGRNLSVVAPQAAVTAG